MPLRLRKIGPFVLAGIGMLSLILRVAEPQSSLLTTERSSHAGPTIEQVRELASLVTTRVELSDCMVTRINGLTGGVEAAVLLRGDLELGIDLSAAKVESVDRESPKAVLTLPRPTVSQPRVDFRRSRLIAVQDKGLWTIVPGTEAQTAVTNLALRDAQKFVEQSADEPALKERAMRQAETVLGSFFRAMGWTVQIRWASECDDVAFRRSGHSRERLLAGVASCAASFLAIGGFATHFKRTAIGNRTNTLSLMTISQRCPRSGGVADCDGRTGSSILSD